MQYREGADIITPDGDKVGTVDRVVMNPGTKKVTHIIVEKGFLFKEDKVVPVDAIVQGDEDKVVLSNDFNDLDNLPDYHERHFISPDTGEYHEALPANSPAPMYYYGPINTWQQPFGFIEPDAPRYVQETEKNVPEGTITIRTSAEVMSREGEKVGEVERIYTDNETNHATHLIIEEGFLFKERKVIPTQWIEKIIDDGTVHLATGKQLLEDLPEPENDTTYETE